MVNQLEKYGQANFQLGSPEGRTRGGDRSLAYGSLAPDSSSEEFWSGDKDSGGGLVLVIEYSLTTT